MGCWPPQYSYCLLPEAWAKARADLSADLKHHPFVTISTTFVTDLPPICLTWNQTSTSLPPVNFSMQLHLIYVHSENARKLTAVTLLAILSTSNRSADATPPNFPKYRFTPISNRQRLEWTSCIGQRPQQQFLQYGKVIDWGPHGVLKESRTNTTTLLSQKTNCSTVWQDGGMARSLIQYYLGNNQSCVHRHVWEILIFAFDHGIHQVKLDKNATIANSTVLEEQLLMTCTSHLYGFALANDFSIDYRNGLYF